MFLSTALFSFAIVEVFAFLLVDLVLFRLLWSVTDVLVATAFRTFRRWAPALLMFFDVPTFLLVDPALPALHLHRLDTSSPGLLLGHAALLFLVPLLYAPLRFVV